MRGQTNFDWPSPLVLSGNCTVVAGRTNVPQAEQLSYPFRRPILIDELRFDLRCDATNPLLASSPPNLGSVVYAKFQLGQHYLMRDYVPIWLLGTTMGIDDEQQYSSDLATQFAYSHYRWKLPEPLYVEAGQVLQSTFSRAESGLLNIPHGLTQDINVQVSYVGRTVSQRFRPRVINVPYVAPYITPWGATYDQSNQYDLFNPFDKPLRVQRMTGRVLFSSTDILGPIVQNLQVLTNNGNPIAAGSALTVQIFDSWGGKVVNNLTGPSDVWDCTRAAWTFDTVMPPKGQYDVRAWNINAVEQLHVAMIGVREEAL